MKKIFSTFILFILLFSLKAQQKVDTIFISTDKFVTIRFPSKIEYYQNSVSINDDIGIKSVDENLFLQYLVADVPETNLLVKTIDNNYYSFILRYSPNPHKLNYLASNNPLTPTKNEVFKTGVPAPMVKEKETKKDESPEEKLLKEKGYLRGRNVSKKKEITIILKGIYVSSDRLYFLLNLENSSNIPLDIESYKFYITSSKGLSSSEQTSELFPISVTPKLHTLLKGQQNIVFMFNKFTISNDKILRFEITEKGGDRNLQHKIFNHQIDDARKL